MTPEQDARKAEFITTNTKAREIYLDGYLRGYEAGFRDADRTAADEYNRAVHAMSHAATEGIDIARYRAKQAGGDCS